MIHGDLKGVCLCGWNYDPILLIVLPLKPNVLIDQNGHARLADFGLLTIISDPMNFVSSSSCTHGGTARWMSPELIDPQRFGLKNGRPTKFSDCYALGMVIYETISGHPPFHQYGDMTVFVKVLAGERPLRGAGFMDSLWKMVDQCWVFQPSDRPSIEVVLQCLEGASNLSEPPVPGVDEEMGTNSNSWDPENEEYSIEDVTDHLCQATRHERQQPQVLTLLPTLPQLLPSPDDVYKRLVGNIESLVPPQDAVSDIVLFPSVLINPASMTDVAYTTGLRVHPPKEIRKGSRPWPPKQPGSCVVCPARRFIYSSVCGRGGGLCRLD